MDKEQVKIKLELPFSINIEKVSNGFVLTYDKELHSEFDNFCVETETMVIEEKDEATDANSTIETDVFRTLIYSLAEYFGMNDIQWNKLLYKD